MYAWLGPDIVVDADDVVAVLGSGDGTGEGPRSVVVHRDGSRTPVPIGCETVARRLVNNRLETIGVKNVG